MVTALLWGQAAKMLFPGVIKSSFRMYQNSGLGPLDENAKITGAGLTPSFAPRKLSFSLGSDVELR